jgi:hypothetical protein
MDIATMVTVLSGVINIFLLILLFLTYTNLISIKIYITQLHTGMASILGKLLSVEQMVNKLGVNFTDFINTTGDMIDKFAIMQSSQHNSSVYKTTDGKFTAASIDDLINKIKKAGSESDYFSDDELNKLKKMFDLDDDYLDDDDDEDDDGGGYTNNYDSTK